MTADEMTLEVFDEILSKVKFELLNYPDRYAYEGAGPRCLIGRYADMDILFENGEFTVHGGENFDEIWCVGFNESGERQQLI